jgi:PAS domain S-box-containing protein
MTQLGASTRLGRWIGGMLVAGGLVVLAGWQLDVGWLKSPVAGTRPMVPATAAMFVVTGLAILLLAASSRRARWLGRAAAAGVAAAGALLFVDHVLGLHPGFVHLFPDDGPVLPPPETSASFALVGLAAALRDLPGRGGAALADALALAEIAIAALLATAHLYGYFAFFEAVPVGAAVHTAVGLMAAGAAILALRPDRGVASVIASGYGGGRLVRRLLAVAAVVIPAAGVISLALQDAGAFPPPGAVVLGATISLIVIMATLVIGGHQLNRAEAQLAQWTRFVDAAPFGAVFVTPDGRLRHVNGAYARMHGADAPAALVGRPLVAMFAPAAVVARRLDELDRRGRLRFEADHVRADGATFPVVVDAAAVRSEDGALRYRVAYVQDITEERRAREDQARLASLVASADDAIFATDLRGTVMAWNAGAERMFGVSAVEAVGASVAWMCPPERSWEMIGLIERLLGGASISGHDTDAVRKDGARVPVSVTATQIEGPGGVRGVSVIARDVTEWRAARRALADTNDDLERISRAKLAVSDAIAGIPRTGLAGVLEVIAREARAVTDARCVAVGLVGRDAHLAPWVVDGGAGTAEAEVRDAIGAIMARGIGSGDRHGVAAPGRDSSLLGLPVTFRGETRGALLIASKDGAADFTARDRRVVQGLALHLGSAIEIALLYQREAVERARVETILGQLPEAVIVLDAGGAPIHENAAALAYRDVDGAPQRYDVRSPSGAPIPVAELPLARAFAHGVASTGEELAVRTPAGEIVPILASAAPIVRGDERVGAVAVFRDIRAIKALERSREEWTSVIAHDLRQPINSIRLAAELLSRQVLTDRATSWADRIGKEVVRLDRMIEDLLDASKLEARRMTVQLAPVVPGALVEAALARIPDLASRCDLHVDPGLGPVHADATRILQVLGNLLSNAAKYGDPDAAIGLAVTRAGESVRITVTNRGPGIPADELPSVFDRFSRTRAARRSAVEGTGLGLYICKGLVEAHGGTIWVDSTPGDTTSFHLTLPAAPADPVAAGPSPVARPVHDVHGVVP